MVWLFGYPVRDDIVEVPGWSVPKEVWETVILSVVMDFILAGSELFHRVKLHQTRKAGPEQLDPEKGAEVPLQPSANQLNTQQSYQ